MLMKVFISFFILNCEIDAKKLKINERDLQPLTLNRDERNSNDFASQIENFHSLLSCDFSSCQRVANTSDCPAFCSLNNDLFSDMLRTAKECLKTVECKRDLNEWRLSELNVTLGVDGYSGQCFLYGKQPIVSGMTDGTINSEIISPQFFAYKLTGIFEVTFSGLSVYCKRCEQDEHTRQLLSDVLCPIADKVNVESVFSRAGVDLRCDGGDVDQSSTWDFTANVTITQSYDVTCIDDVASDQTTLGNIYLEATDAIVSSSAPSEYADSVRIAVINEMLSYQITTFIPLTYFHYIFDSLTNSFQKCPVGKDCPK